MSEETIHQYLEGSLDEQATSAFESSLAADPQLATQVELMKEMKSYGKVQDQTERAQRVIRDVGHKYNPSHQAKPQQGEQSKVKIKRLRYLIPAIAAILLIGIILNSLFQSTAQDDTSSLYAHYAEVTPLSLSTRSTENNELVTTAEEYFNSQDYSEAIHALTSIIAQDVDNAKAIFYRGYAYIADDQYEAGRKDLMSLLDNTLYQHTASYHIALSYIKSGSSSLAVPYLKEIPASSNHHAQAQEILKIINE